MKPLLNVAAAFSIGAALVYWLGAAMWRRRVTLPITDSQLCEKVRARLPELVTYPQAIEVGVEAGIVRVSGRVLARELDGLLMRLIQIPGVRKVQNALASLDETRLDEIVDRGHGALPA